MRKTALLACAALLLGVAMAQTSGGGIGTQSNTSPSNVQPTAPSQPCNCPCANQSQSSMQQQPVPQGTRVYNSTDASTNSAPPTQGTAGTYNGQQNSGTYEQQNSGNYSQNQAGTSSTGTSAGSVNQSGSYPQTNAAPQQNPQSQTNPQSSQQTQQPEEPVFGTRRPAPTNIPMARTVPVGTEIHATLDTPLSSKSAQSGQPFTATLADPLTNQSGTILVPAGARIRGEVADAESGKILPSMRGRGRLNLRFRDISLPDGTTLPITATLISVVDTAGKNTANTSQEGEVTGKTTGTRTAKDIGIGAGLGTVAGLIFGSALKGLAIGAIAGGGYVLANGGKDVELPAEAGLRLRLDQMLTVPQNSAGR